MGNQSGSSRSLPIAQPFVPPSRHELSATQLFALVLFCVLLPLPPCYWLLYVPRENTIYPLHRSAAATGTFRCCCSRSTLLALLLQNTIRDSCSSSSRPATAVSRFSSPAYAIRHGWWRDCLFEPSCIHILRTAVGDCVGRL